MSASESNVKINSTNQLSSVMFGMMNACVSVVKQWSQIPTFLRVLMRVGYWKRAHYIHTTEFKQQGLAAMGSTAVIFSMIDGSWDDVTFEAAANDVEFNAVVDPVRVCNDKVFSETHNKSPSFR